LRSHVECIEDQHRRACCSRASWIKRVATGETVALRWPITTHRARVLKHLIRCGALTASRGPSCPIDPPNPAASLLYTGLSTPPPPSPQLAGVLMAEDHAWYPCTCAARRTWCGAESSRRGSRLDWERRAPAREQSKQWRGGCRAQRLVWWREKVALGDMRGMLGRRRLCAASGCPDPSGTIDWTGWGDGRPRRPATHRRERRRPAFRVTRPVHPPTPKDDSR